MEADPQHCSIQPKFRIRNSTFLCYLWGAVVSRVLSSFSRAFLISLTELPLQSIVHYSEQPADTSPGWHFPGLSAPQKSFFYQVTKRSGIVQILSGHLHRPLGLRVPGSQGEIPCNLSPVGYPRERQRALAEHMRQRLLLLEI